LQKKLNGQKIEFETLQQKYSSLVRNYEGVANFAASDKAEFTRLKNGREAAEKAKAAAEAAARAAQSKTLLDETKKRAAAAVTGEAAASWRKQQAVQKAKSLAAAAAAAAAARSAAEANAAALHTAAIAEARRVALAEAQVCERRGRAARLARDSGFVSSRIGEARELSVAVALLTEKLEGVVSSAARRSAVDSADYEFDHRAHRGAAPRASEASPTFARAAAAVLTGAVAGGAAAMRSAVSVPAPVGEVKSAGRGSGERERTRYVLLARRE
jgi:hypothetical protein